MQILLDKYWKITSIVILALGIGWIWMSAAPPGTTTSGAIPAPQEGFQAPNFELNTLDGESITLADMRGKAVLLNFWTTWCPPCRSEMSAMERVFEDYESTDFLIVAVNGTFQDNSGNVKTFVSEQGLSFPILLDTSGEVSDLYQVKSLPTSFFINTDGVINEIVIGGPMAEALIRTRVDQLFKE